MQSKLVVIAVSLAVLSAITSIESGIRTQDNEKPASVGRIEGSAKALAVVDKVRAALGGADRLAAVRSLLIEGTSRGEAFTYRLLLPDRFQHVLPGYTFTVSGSESYWQRPDPGETVKAEARLRKIALFAEQSLTLLMRTPSSVPIKASLPKPMNAGGLELFFSGPNGFGRLMFIDPFTFRPKGYLYAVSVTGAECTDDGPVPIDLGKGTMRYTFDEFGQVGGIWFPMRLTLEMTGGGRTSAFQIEQTIRVNEGVSADAFKER
jgi:hypothetical protein